MTGGTVSVHNGAEREPAGAGADRLGNPVGRTGLPFLVFAGNRMDNDPSRSGAGK